MWNITFKNADWRKKWKFYKVWGKKLFLSNANEKRVLIEHPILKQKAGCCGLNYDFVFRLKQHMYILF